MDWRSYFTLPAVDDFLEKDYQDDNFLEIMKTAAGKLGGASGGFQSSQHPRDKKGRFTFKHGKAPKRVNEAGVTVDFNKLPLQKQREIIKRAMLSSVKASSGVAGMSADRIMFHVSMATGQHPSKALAKQVGGQLAALAKTGEITVNLSERAKRDKSGKVQLVKEELRVYKDKAKTILDYEASIAKTPVYEFRVTEKGRMHETKGTFSSLKGYDFKHSGDISRPIKLETNPDSMHGKMLAQRRQVYPDSKTASMGRFFSTDKNAPENTHTHTKESVALLRKSASAAQVRLNAAMKTGNEDLIKSAKREYKTLKHESDVASGLLASNKLERHKAFPNDQFYDATSSVNGIVGTITGNKSMLQNSHLQDFGEMTYSHTKALEHAGIAAKNAHKPYFANTLSGVKTVTPADLKDIGKAYGNDKDKTAEALKKASKAIFTPGTYGSKIHGTTYLSQYTGKQVLASNGARDAAKVLVNSGMTHENATAAAKKMAENFQSSPLQRFNSAFGEVIKNAPAGFVYTNPMSGYQMSFDKFKITKTENKIKSFLSINTRMPTIDAKGNIAEKQVKIPYALSDRDTRSTNSGAAALFVQNWDSAIISSLGTSTGSSATLHDAIAIPKTTPYKTLQTQVAAAYNKAAKLDPIKNLADQIKDQLKVNQALAIRAKKLGKLGGTKPLTKKAFTKKLWMVDQSLSNFRKLGDGPGIVNVPDGNNHFVEE